MPSITIPFDNAQDLSETLTMLLGQCGSPAPSDLEAVVNHAYDTPSRAVRILYRGEADSRATWRLVEPQTEVRSALIDPAERYFRALDLAAPDGEDRRCYRLSRVERFEAVPLAEA